MNGSADGLFARAGVWRSTALLGALLLVAGAHPARAAINVWTSNGPDGVNVFSLAVDPVTPSTLYAGTGGGVFKSTDAGNTWHAANTGLPANAAVSALAIDPTTPSTLYVGASFVPVLLNMPLLNTSTDAGSTWHAANTGLPANVAVLALAIDPKAPSTLYAGVDSVFKSTDTGNSWSNTSLPATEVFALAIDPTTSATLYAGGAGGVFKTTDAGNTWSTSSLPDTGVFALAIAPTTPTTLYAGTDRGVYSIQQVAVCIGDCGGTLGVAVNDVITLVNIALALPTLRRARMAFRSAARSTSR